jgi:predicted ATPase with chaperone activity
VLCKVGKIQTLMFNRFLEEIVYVEAQILPGMSSFTIVGMANKCVVEAKERIRGAFYSSKFTFPHNKILVNLSPAAISKTGTHYDLPIALAILNAMNIVKNLSNYICVGELSLTGKIVGDYGCSFAIENAIQNNTVVVLGSDAEKTLSSYKELPNIYMSNTLNGIIQAINNNIYFEYNLHNI